MAYGVVETCLMTGTYNPVYLRSVKYYDGDPLAPTEIENGNVALLAGLLSGEREIYKVTDVAANSDLSQVVLIASPEYMTDERKRNLNEFRNEAGDVARGYLLHSNDQFGLSRECWANASGDDPVVGDVVELAAGTKLQAVTTATQNSTVVGAVTRIETIGGITFYVVTVA
jgi:hypothetical protein